MNNNTCNVILVLHPQLILVATNFEALKRFEIVEDVAAHRESKSADDGQPVTLEQVRRDLVSSALGRAHRRHRTPARG